MAHLLNAESHALAILQNAAQRVAYSGFGGDEASMAITTLHNAVLYLLTGRIVVERASHIWFNRFPAAVASSAVTPAEVRP